MASSHAGSYPFRWRHFRCQCIHFHQQCGSSGNPDYRLTAENQDWESQLRFENKNYQEHLGPALLPAFFVAFSPDMLPLRAILALAATRI